MMVLEDLKQKRSMRNISEISGISLLDLRISKKRKNSINIHRTVRIALNRLVLYIFTKKDVYD